MCRQIEAIDALTAAANALARACHCRMEAISISLHHAYDYRLADTIPTDIADLLDKLGASRGRG